MKKLAGGFAASLILATLIAVFAAFQNTGSGGMTPYPNTYTCGVSNITAAATPTNIVTITGSSNPNITVRITQFHMYATQTTGGVAVVKLNHQTAADTGGTFVQDGTNPYDKNNGASTVVCGHYTANPTAIGTVAGSWRQYAPLVPTSTTFPTGEILEPFGDGIQPLTLHGTTDIMAVNMGGATVAGFNFTIQIEYTETLAQ